MWDKAAEYLKKVGGTILVAVIIIWALKFYPQDTEQIQKKEQQIAKVEQNTAISEPLKEEKLKEINMAYEKAHLEQSYLRQIGHAIEPVITPIGLDWRMGISIVTGIAAKEIVVSTLGVIYQTDDENNQSLISKLREESRKTGERKAMYNLRALSFLIFILIYFPCVGVVAAVKKETNGWKWPVFLVVYTTGLAWVMSFLVFQVGKFMIQIL